MVQDPDQGVLELGLKASDSDLVGLEVQGLDLEVQGWGLGVQDSYPGLRDLDTGLQELGLAVKHQNNFQVNSHQYMTPVDFLAGRIWGGLGC